MATSKNRRAAVTCLSLLPLALAILIAQGCSEPAEMRCVPGKQLPCRCGIDTTGIQTCSSDGSDYSSCDCSAQLACQKLVAQATTCFDDYCTHSEAAASFCACWRQGADLNASRCACTERALEAACVGPSAVDPESFDCAQARARIAELSQSCPL